MVGAMTPQPMARSQMGRLQMLEHMARIQIDRKKGKTVGIHGKPIGVLADGRAIKSGTAIRVLTDGRLGRTSVRLAARVFHGRFPRCRQSGLRMMLCRKLGIRNIRVVRIALSAAT